jgi:hypothetical protein
VGNVYSASKLQITSIVQGTGSAVVNAMVNGGGYSNLNDAKVSLQNSLISMDGATIQKVSITTLNTTTIAPANSTVPPTP